MNQMLVDGVEHQQRQTETTGLRYREQHQGERVGGEHQQDVDRRAAQAANGRHDDDGAIFALNHLRCGKTNQPMVGYDVVFQDFAELVIPDTGQGAVIGVGCGVAHQNVNLAQPPRCFGHQVLQVVFGGDIGRNRNCAALAVRRVDGPCDLFTGLGFA